MTAKGLKVRSVEMRGVVRSHAEVTPLLKKTGDMALVKRGLPRLLIMVCPCGCGEQLVINLDKRAGPAWLFYNKNKKYSLYPSVWRDSGCESHFILWDNRVLWFDYGSWWDDQEDLKLDDKVFAFFKIKRSLHYSEIADTMQEVPWEILRSCRRLAKKGLLREQKGKDNHGIFELKK